MRSTSTLSDRQGLWAFILGVIAVTAGVLMHAPMFLMGRDMGYRLYGMPMGNDMVAGMVLIVAGVAVAAYGLLPRNISQQLAASQEIVVSPPEDAPLTRAHWQLMFVLVIALVIDIMKPASLGFTIPGMVAEYGVPKQVVSLVPLFALTGTVVGSIVWGIIADIYGRKASILLSAVMFVALIQAMPSPTGTRHVLHDECRRRMLRLPMPAG
jgi:putative MFS transporter